MALKLKQVGLIFNSPLQQHSSDELLWASEERALQTGDSGCFTQGANADQGHISARSCPTTGMGILGILSETACRWATRFHIWPNFPSYFPIINTS